MEYLPNGYTLEAAPGTFPLSTDSMVLAHFVSLPGNARVLDLGSGCGTLGVLLCASDPKCHVTGIEISPEAHAAALSNIGRNGLSSRMESICTDLRDLSGQSSPGRYSVCISNPPYFSGGPASGLLPDARKETCCTLSQLMAAAAWALKYGGDFYLVHRPERLAEIIAKASENGLEAKLLRLLHHRQDGPVSLILLKFRKGAKPGLILDEKDLFDRNGHPTEYYNAVYHLPGGNA